MSLEQDVTRILEANENPFKGATKKEIEKRRPRNTVVISVSGGVAEVEYAPPGIKVEIVDYDNLEAEGR